MTNHLLKKLFLTSNINNSSELSSSISALSELSALSSSSNLSISYKQFGGNNSDTNTVLKMIFIIILFFFIYVVYKMEILNIDNFTLLKYFMSNKDNKNNKDNKDNNKQESEYKQNENTDNNIQIIETPVHRHLTPDIYGILRNYDYKTYNDPLTPPYKRDDYMIPAHVIDPYRFGIYTRGGPTAFKKMGYLNNKNANPGDPYKFLTLMGRQKYYNSSQYQYYIVSTNKDENIKFDLEKYKKELYSGDTISVPQLDNIEYEVNIDKNLDYDYIPYII